MQCAYTHNTHTHTHTHARRIWIKNLPVEANLDELKKNLLEFMALQHLRVFNEGEAILSIQLNPIAAGNHSQYLYMYVCTHICMNTFAVFVYVCMYVYIYVYIYIYIYTYKYIHIRIYI